MSRAFLTLALLTLSAAHVGFATPPPNDTCAGAEVIPAAGQFPFLTAIVDVKDATKVGDPSLPTCFTNVDRSVWYRFTPPTTRLYTIACSGDTATTVRDTVMAIYSSAAGCSGPFTQVDCNDDAGYAQSAISSTLISNVTYYIVVWQSIPFLPFEPTTVQLRVSQPEVPANDQCAAAEVIPTDAPFPYLTAVSDATLATETSDPILPTCNNQAVRSVWYRFTPAITAPYEFSLCTNTATTVYDTLIGVYTGTCGASFSRVGCNDDSSACGGGNADLNFRSVLTMPLTNGVNYFIVVWESGHASYIPGETSLQLRVTRLLAPVATTLGATNLSLASAAITGSVNPNNLPTTAWFEWGTTISYGSNTAPQALAAANSALPVSATLNGLTPGTTYHFRLRATNSLGTSLGADQSLLAALAPTTETLGPFGLTSTSAVLQASVTPNAAAAFAWFQYGLTTNYGSATTPANLGAATSPMNLQSAIGGLTPGVLHHFRVVASNSIGTGLGTNRTFAWSAAPPNFTGFFETNSGFALRFTGQSAQLYAVESSTNLIDWTSLGLSTELGGGLFQLIAPGGLPADFFRVVAP